MQSSMYYACSVCIAGKTGSFCKIRLGGYCTCFLCSDKEGRTKSKDTWAASTGFYLRIVIADNLKGRGRVQ
jgi:hypothetical protein